MKTIYIMIFCLASIRINSLGHEQIVHQAITMHASESAFDYSSAYKSFISLTTPDLAPKDSTNALVTGSFNEDYAPDKDPVGGYRSLNHFYDPLDVNFYQGLSDSPPDRRVQLGINSFNWGSISNCIGYNYYGAFYLPFFGKNAGTKNIWSWQNARDYEWIGLTAATQSERQTNLLKMFTAVGQVMHLLEDTTQPQHVRNEQHLDRFKAWHSPIEIYGKTNVANLNYQHGMLDWKGLGFTKLEDFWDRHLYNGSYVALNNDANNVAGARLGLAEFVNGNFLGDRHSYAEYFRSDSIKYYPYPSRNISTDYLLKKDYLSSGIGNYKLHNGYQAKGIYLRKNDAGIAITHHSRFTLEGVKHPQKSTPKSTTIRDDNVLHDYHDKLIPKAVEYSAGMLDYFFRGQFNMGMQGGSDIGTVIFSITNISSQPFTNGSFTLLKEEPGQNRTIVTNYPVNGVIPNGGIFDVAYNDDTITTNTVFYMVYRGTIGFTGSNASDPIDKDIAIAVKKFQQPPPASCPFTQTVWEAPVYDTSLGPITASATNNTINISGSYSSAGPTSLTSMYATGSFFYMGPAFNAYVHLDPNAYGLANQGQIQIEIKVFIDDELINDDILPSTVNVHGSQATYYNGFTFTVPQSSGVTVRTEVTCIYGANNAGVNQSGFMNFGVVLECGDAPSRIVFFNSAKSATADYYCDCIDFSLPHGFVYAGDLQTYPYTVPAGTVSSLASQADADYQAQILACADAQAAAGLFGPRLGCQTTDHPNGMVHTMLIGFPTPPCH